jgi:hypothetical protein
MHPFFVNNRKPAAGFSGMGRRVSLAGSWEKLGRASATKSKTKEIAGATFRQCRLKRIDLIPLFFLSG